ncbi:hypothetical protein L198_01828 [Cryptococcus wingfieldii CBS 7118]|uniref:Uncharacterized protein n=1 Tax=Cryptococcus wingfieldii CBS 7118 TaxID=1295528 RepID=A0A1E3JWH1_9TREE|nr:hypothetical protein L198_01828 [Cryptococcus wingfieldii CBS 7118]ODO05140.1 hypothetical protein L198_01828 [Cryptococcus wingfieldii CBS 7118]
MQDVEDHKPRLSKISWLPDLLVFRGSILPTIIGPVLWVTLFSAGVAAASIWWGKEVGLTNNVVPLLSVVVGLLLVFRNSSAYERYAEGRKDFTALISVARNLSRNIWVAVTLPPTPTDGSEPLMTREQLTLEKMKVIRLVVAFVVATKHHLRAEGGVHHDDLKGLLPPRLANSHLSDLKSSIPLLQPLPEENIENVQSPSYAAAVTGSPRSIASELSDKKEDEESSVGLSRSSFSPNAPVSPSPSLGGIVSRASSLKSLAGSRPRTLMKRRPTAVRVVVPEDIAENHSSSQTHSRSHSRTRQGRIDERTPLIKAGVKPDPMTTLGMQKKAETGLGRMVELGLPLIIAHDISRSIFKFRRMGCLEAIGPAVRGYRVTEYQADREKGVQTPLPYIFCVHLKQVVSLYLFILPFTLVDSTGWKMVFIMFCISMTFMGVEGIAAMIEQPFGTDPCDLNLDLAILERLPEGDDDDITIYKRSTLEQAAADYGADDGGDE